MRDAGIDSVGCMASTIQLVIHDGLLKHWAVDEVLSTARSIVGHFKHSLAASEKLIKMQRNLQLPIRHLVQDVPTRCSSSYLMLERLLEQQRAITLYMSENPSCKMLTLQQWSLAENLCLLLKPFETKARRLSSAIACASDIISTVTVLCHTITYMKVDGLLTL